MSHKHEWKDVSYDFVWVYEFFRCASGSRWCTWNEFKIYQKEFPGTVNADCSLHGSHSRHPNSHTIIHQKCECGNYREQYVDGILNIESDIECKEEPKVELGDKLKK